MISLAPTQPGNNEPSQPQATAPSSRRTPRGLPQNSGGVSVSSSTNWLPQLLAVDFRHAFWPWIAYAAGAIFLTEVINRWLPPPPSFGSVESSSFALYFLVAPVIIVRIFCTDFAHGTHERLLTFPVSRMTIWGARYALAVVLLFAPLLIANLIFVLQQSQWWPHEMKEFSLNVTILVMHLTAGMLCIFLRKPLITWTTMVITPLLIIIVWAIGHEWIGDFFEPTKLGTFDFLAIPIMLICAAALILATYLWKHLEVRQ